MATNRERMGLILISILTVKFSLVLSFNVDIDNKIVYTTSEKYFGYSLSYYKTR